MKKNKQSGCDCWDKDNPCNDFKVVVLIKKDAYLTKQGNLQICSADIDIDNDVSTKVICHRCNMEYNIDEFSRTEKDQIGVSI